MGSLDVRRAALETLVGYTKNVEGLKQLLTEFTWDSETELVVLSRSSLVAVLARYLDSDISARDLVSWANLLEMREDIGFEPPFEEMIGNFVFEAANPDIEGAISFDWAQSWLRRFRIDQT